jgi:DNA-nicking Smr family endonuclease
LAKRSKKQKAKDFQNSPFKGLKGVAVAEDRVSAEKNPAPLPTCEPLLEDDATAFEREMALLGVNPQAQEDRQQEVEPIVTDLAAEMQEKTVELTDDELFLDSLGKMDSVFYDEIPQAEEAAAAPRRMRQLRQGKLAPEAKLDLHGLNRQEAREKVRFFLEDATFNGFKTVLIITGRGKGSPAGPVLRQFMESYLSSDARAWVVEWGRAPARYGGEGALVVFLKGRRQG